MRSFSELRGAFTADELREQLAREEAGEVDSISTKYRDGLDVHGLRGVVIPTARERTGGSYGFDAHEPAKIIVDPDKPSSYVIDTKKFRKDTRKKRPAADPATSMRELAEQEGRLDLVEQINEQMPTPEQVDKLPPMPTPSKEAQSNPAPFEPTEEKRDITPKQITSYAEPQIKVSFDLGDFGSLDAYYHRVIRDGDVVVLVWDASSKAMRYQPPVNVNKVCTFRVSQEREPFEGIVFANYLDEAHNEEHTVIMIRG